MTEISDDKYEAIVKFSEQGEQLFSLKKYQKALHKYKQALMLVPKPKIHWDASTWLYTAIGDCHYMMKEYKNGLDAFSKAITSPEGVNNPFINLRLGQCHFETGNIESAENAFFRAFVLDGERIFESENKKYLNHLKTHYNI